MDLLDWIVIGVIFYNLFSNISALEGRIKELQESKATAIREIKL